MTTFRTMTVSTLDRVAFLRVAGELDIACSEELRQLGIDAITDYVDTMRIDMSAVTFIDSTTLGALIAIRNKAIEHHCVLILEKPQPQVMRVLDLTALTSVFTIETS